MVKTPIVTVKIGIKDPIDTLQQKDLSVLSEHSASEEESSRSRNSSQSKGSSQSKDLSEYISHAHLNGMP